MIIGGTSYQIRPWPTPKTTWAVDWHRIGNRYWRGRDRGLAEDIYQGSVLVQGSDAIINNLKAVLHANRGSITLSGFNTGEMVFGADVDYSGSITATVVDFGERRNVFHTGVFELEVSFLALAPTLLATPPSLADLHFQEGWSGDISTDVQKHFSYRQDPSYLDHETDVGLYKARFLQTSEEMKAIRAYLLTIARGTPITFPYLMAGLYPYGTLEAESIYQKCHVVEWADRRIGLNRWELNLSLAQADPYFAAGDDAADDFTEADHLSAGSSGTPALHGTPGG